MTGTIKAVSGDDQRSVRPLPDSVRLLSLHCRVLSKQCSVSIKVESGDYQSSVPLLPNSVGYCRSSVRLLLKQCSATSTITRVSEYIIKALPGYFQTSVQLLSNYCSTIIKAVWLLWKPHTTAITKVAGHCECSVRMSERPLLLKFHVLVSGYCLQNVLATYFEIQPLY